jgi:DNA-binding response OmpR family regulator
MRILVVEDEQLIGGFIENTLTKNLFSVIRAESQKKAFEILKSHTIDLIILDMLLPDGHGLKILKHIRSKNDNTPVLILSAENEVVQKVRGLNAGADDYLAKPFHQKELIARVQSLLRRESNQKTTSLMYENISLCLETFQVQRNKQEVILTRKEIKILQKLLYTPEKVISRDEIFEAVWGTNDPFEFRSNTFDVTINSLRKKLNKYGENIIHTFKGLGYMINKDKPNVS